MGQGPAPVVRSVAIRNRIGVHISDNGRAICDDPAISVRLSLGRRSAHRELATRFPAATDLAGRSVGAVPDHPVRRYGEEKVALLGALSRTRPGSVMSFAKCASALVAKIDAKRLYNPDL